MMIATALTLADVMLVLVEWIVILTAVLVAVAIAGIAVGILIAEIKYLLGL